MLTEPPANGLSLVMLAIPGGIVGLAVGWPWGWWAALLGLWTGIGLTAVGLMALVVRRRGG